MTATKFGWQFIGKPPENYRAQCGGSKGIKIVGDETDLTQLRDWTVEVKQARLITAEPRIEAVLNSIAIADIPAFAATIAAEFAAVAARVNVAGVWWEIPYIMPAVTPVTCAWYPAAAEAFRAVGLKSVVWGFATGTPQTAPWANGNSPDEWPSMYPGLARLHALGPNWTRLGVEEYVTDGRLIPGDFSNCGRIAEVYNRHIKPHGWNIVFRGIEAGYDIPGMRDAGIVPDNVLTGRDGSGGLAAADARYAPMAFVDCMYLYQVSDPGVVQNEAAFAFTPGDKNGPGYLDVMRDYFIANPPALYVPPGPTTPTDPPPTIPPTLPPPVEGPELIVNGDFTGGTYSVPGNPDQRVMPNGWQGRSPQDRTEIEEDPHFDPPCARVIQAYERREIGLVQTVTVEAGARYNLVVKAAPWCVTDPSDPFSLCDSPGEIRLRANGVVVATVPYMAGDDPTAFLTLGAVVTPTGTSLTVECNIKPVYAVTRTDLRIDSVSLKKIGAAVPPITTTLLVKVVNVGSYLNVRSGPGTTYAVIGQLPKGLVFLVEEPYNTWAKVAGVSGYVSATYIQRI